MSRSLQMSNNLLPVHSRNHALSRLMRNTDHYVVDILKRASSNLHGFTCTDKLKTLALKSSILTNLPNRIEHINP